MKAVKKNLKDQVLTNDKAIMLCRKCGAIFSANAGDYWNLPDSYVFKHCGRTMELVRKIVSCESV